MKRFYHLMPVFIVCLFAGQNIFPLKNKAAAITVNPKQGDEIIKIINGLSAHESVLFKKGTYYISGPIQIQNKSFIKLRGEEGVFLILNNINSSVMEINQSDNVEITGLHIRHRRPISPHEVCNGAVVYVQNSHDIYFSHLELNGSGTKGMVIDFSTSISLISSWIHDNSVAGVELNNFVDNIRLENNRFENNPEHLASNFLKDSEWNRYVKMKNNYYDAAKVMK